MYMNLTKYCNFTVEERSRLKKHQRRLIKSGSTSIIRLGRRKAAAEHSQHALLHAVVVVLHLPSLGLGQATGGNNGKRNLKLEKCSWSLELMSKLQAKAECANQQHP